MAISKKVRIAFNKPNRHELYLIVACQKRLESAENARTIVKQIEQRITTLQNRNRPVSDAMIKRLEYYRGVEARQMQLYNRDVWEIADYNIEKIDLYGRTTETTQENSENDNEQAV